MTSSKGETMQVNDIVIFSPRQGETAEGIVTRVWDKPASDPYVTIKMTGKLVQTFVRCSSEVRSKHLAEVHAWARENRLGRYRHGTGA